MDAHRPTAAAIHDFAALPRGGWYDCYRRIKKQVFGQELGWVLDSDREASMAAPDEFDALAAYTFLCADHPDPVGVVRGMALRDGFPHRSLFAGHLSRDELRTAQPLLCTLNALAVLPAYRQRHFTVESSGWRGSAGRLLAVSQLELQRTRGMGGAIITAGGYTAARFFQKLGFKVMDPPVRTSLHDGLLTNMAVCFHDEAYTVGLRNCGRSGQASPPDSSLAAFAGYLDGLKVCQELDRYDW